MRLIIRTISIPSEWFILHALKLLLKLSERSLIHKLPETNSFTLK